MTPMVADTDGNTASTAFPLAVAQGAPASAETVELAAEAECSATAERGTAVLKLSAKRKTNGDFTLLLNAPEPGSYIIEASSNLSMWEVVAVVTNTTGTVRFTSPSLRQHASRFYRAARVPSQ